MKRLVRTAIGKLNGWYIDLYLGLAWLEEGKSSTLDFELWIGKILVR